MESTSNGAESSQGSRRKSQRTRPPRQQRPNYTRKYYQDGNSFHLDDASSLQEDDTHRNSRSRYHQSSTGNSKTTAFGKRQVTHYKAHDNKSKSHASCMSHGSAANSSDAYAYSHPASDFSSENSGQSAEGLKKEIVESCDNAEGGSSLGCIVNGRYVRKTGMQVLSSSSSSNSPSKRVEDIPIEAGAVPLAFSNNKKHMNYEQQYSGTDYNSNYYGQPPPSHRNRGNYYNSNKSQYNKAYGRKRQKDRAVNQTSSDEHAKAVTAEEQGGEEEPAVDNYANNYEPKQSTKKFAFSKKSFQEKTQRDRLIHQLEKGQYECVVCCEVVRTRDYIWSCNNCYHVFHLRCIKKWARSPTAVDKDGRWRCPTCQAVVESIPYSYFCFCGKKKEPEVNLHYTPHSCGEVCGKQRDDKNCVHSCTLLCHPGPCPPCSATINKSCECGKTKKTVPCNQAAPVTCGMECEKILNCGVHTCDNLCHEGSCNPCAVIIKQECYCAKANREVCCDEVTSGQYHYSCGMTCEKPLACGNHKCSQTCHSGSCGLCSLLPEFVTTCSCGKMPLSDLYEARKASRRQSCTDPIPVCGQKCEKELPCGPKDNHHRCSSSCHVGRCPLCSLTTVVKCQCSSTSKDVPCKDLQFPYVFSCEKRCNKRKNCGRHKCLKNCCTISTHVCELVCNKKLPCGSHQCQERCHGGNCPPCWNVSFDELRCHCGYSVIYPPIHCGTAPPECGQPCARSHSCDHEVRHTCHNDPTCPPCTALVEKWCFGHHEKRSNVQCFLDGISCGKPCDKPLPCGNHSCREICHAGSCIKANGVCTQLCEKPRSCGHPCNIPCHSGPCPETPCKAKVNVSCPCGFRTETSTCSEDSTSYRLVSLSRMAAKMNDIKSGDTVNISDILGKKGKYNRLLCNEDCAIHERNKRLAIALQIQNPDLSCKPGPPNYSEFLKEEARKNMKFVMSVYDKFSELVQLAKQSKQKSRSYAFPPMNRDHRRVVHEMAEFFGCETQSYDEEPVKNVVITAYKDRSWLPFVSISTVMEREMGLRRGPAPVISTASKVPTQVSTAEKKTKAIDYFDYDG